LAIDFQNQKSGRSVLDIVPLKPITDLPLSKEGKITCITCHAPHDKSGFPMLLRAAPSGLRLKCHFK